MICSDTLAELYIWFPAVRELSPMLRERLQREAEELYAPPGRRLFETGAAPADLPLVTRGALCVLLEAGEDRRVLLGRVEPGRCCGLSANCLLGDAPFPAGALADGTLRGARLPRPLLLALLDEAPHFRTFVMREAASQSAAMIERVGELLAHRVPQRLATLLLARRSPLETTHHALAVELGTAREVVSRTLADLRNRGVLRLSRGRIEVVDRAALGGLAAGRRPPGPHDRLGRVDSASSDPAPPPADALPLHEAAPTAPAAGYRSYD